MVGGIADPNATGVGDQRGQIIPSEAFEKCHEGSDLGVRERQGLDERIEQRMGIPTAIVEPHHLVEGRE